MEHVGDIKTKRTTFADCPFTIAREERFELPTAGFGDQCSTTELLPCIANLIGIAVQRYLIIIYFPNVAAFIFGASKEKKKPRMGLQERHAGL